MPSDHSIALRASISDAVTGVPGSATCPCFPSVVPPCMPLPAGDFGATWAAGPCTETMTLSWPVEDACRAEFASRTCGSPTNDAEDSRFFLADACAVLSALDCGAAPAVVSRGTLCEVLRAGSLARVEQGKEVTATDPAGLRNRLTGTPVRSLVSGTFCGRSRILVVGTVGLKLMWVIPGTVAAATICRREGQTSLFLTLAQTC